MPKIKSVRDRYNDSNIFSWKHKIMKDDEERYGFITLLKYVNVDGQKLVDEKIYCPVCKKGFIDGEDYDIKVPRERTKEEWYSLNQRSDEPTEEYIEHYEESITVAHRCPDCGRVAVVENCLQIDQRNKDNQSIFPVWAGVMDDDPDGPFVRFKWITMKLTGWHDKLQVENRYYYVLFNTESGQTFYFEPYVKPDGVRGRRAPWYDGPRMKNIVFAFEGRNELPDTIIPREIRQELFDKIYEKISKRLGYKPKKLGDYYDDRKRAERQEMAEAKAKKKKIIPPSVTHGEEYTIREIALYNRQPNMDPKLYEKLVERARRPVQHTEATLDKYRALREVYNNEVEVVSSKKKNKKPKTKAPRLQSTVVDKKVSSIRNTECNPIGKLMDNFKIPQNKSLRKAILKNYADIFKLKIVMEFFKDINNIRKIMETSLFANENYYSWMSEDKNNYYNRNYKSEIQSFMVAMTEKFGETVWANKIAAGNGSHLQDTASMYHQLLKKKIFKLTHCGISKLCYSQQELDRNLGSLRGDEETTIVEKVDVPMDLTGNLSEIHDNLSSTLDIMEHPNYELISGYKEEELKLERETDDYIIKLAEDTHELRRAGKAMHICVGGYGDRALRRDLNIVLMIDKKDQSYVMCLEMSSDFKRVYQAKAECNYFPEGPSKDVIVEWIQDNKMIVETNDLPELCVRDAGRYGARRRPQAVEPAPAAQQAADPFDDWNDIAL